MTRCFSRSITIAALFVAPALAQDYGYNDSPVATNQLPTAEAPVVVYLDVMPICPRRGCWAVTCEAFLRLPGVERVQYEPTAENLRLVSLTEKSLPDPTVWEEKFRDYVGTASEFRAVVIDALGTVRLDDGSLTFVAEGYEPLRLTLAGRPFRWADDGPTSFAARVTGSLTRADDGFELEVRKVIPQP